MLHPLSVTATVFSARCQINSTGHRRTISNYDRISVTGLRHTSNVTSRSSMTNEASTCIFNACDNQVSCSRVQIARP